MRGGKREGAGRKPGSVARIDAEARNYVADATARTLRALDALPETQIL
jgi:hypothetical protein